MSQEFLLQVVFPDLNTSIQVMELGDTTNPRQGRVGYERIRKAMSLPIKYQTAEQCHRDI
jgi:hypothetical protein